MQLSGALRTLVRFIAFALCVFALTSTSRAETPIPPAPAEWVTDTAGLLSAQTVQQENAQLETYERTSGHQILVYVAPTTGGTPIEDWAVRAFAKWKVGRKNLDDGLVLFIFSKDHALRIEVGYGLEGSVTDVQASRIIRDTIAPGLKAGKPDAAVTAGIDQILQLTGGVAPAATAMPGTRAPDSADSGQLTPLELILIAILVIGFIILAIRSPSTALYLLVTIMSRGGGGGGGGSFGGGGFSGGGGRSGGGGASGTW